MILWNLIGSSAAQLGQLDEAVLAFQNAISIKPDYADAYNNMGNALKDQGKLEEAIQAYNKAISLKPNFVDPYNNMSIALQELGMLDEALQSCTKALSLKPDYSEAWNNIYYVITALKTKVANNEELAAFYPKNFRSNYAKIALNFLKYELHLGHKSIEGYLEKTLKSLATLETTTIQNTTFNVEVSHSLPEISDKLVALVHFGRSGTGLMHSLIDGHPQVSTLPSIYFSEYFNPSTWKRITSGGWDKMIDHFISIYDVLFDASSSVPVESKGKQLRYNVGISMGMANVGNERDEVLRVDKDLFRAELKRLMACYHQLDAFIFLN